MSNKIAKAIRVNLQISICCMLVQLLEIYHGYCKRKPHSTNKSLCTVMSEVWHLHIIQSEISQEKSKIMNFEFCKRSYQPIWRYLHTEAIKRRGEISLHKHFNSLFQICWQLATSRANTTCWRLVCRLATSCEIFTCVY